MPAVAQPDRQSLESLVASARNPQAAAERGTDRWIRPTWRMIAGRARHVMAPASALPRRAAGSGAAPALASARGTIASRAAVCTAICGVTPTAASACSRRMRVEVPGAPRTTGSGPASPAPRGRAPAGADRGGVRTGATALPVGGRSTARRGEGGCAAPSSHAPSRTSARTPSALSGSRTGGLRLRGGRCRSRQQSRHRSKAGPGWRCLASRCLRGPWGFVWPCADVRAWARQVGAPRRSRGPRARWRARPRRRSRCGSSGPQQECGCGADCGAAEHVRRAVDAKGDASNERISANASVTSPSEACCAGGSRRRLRPKLSRGRSRSWRLLRGWRTGGLAPGCVSNGRASGVELGNELANDQAASGAETGCHSGASHAAPAFVPSKRAGEHEQVEEQGL
jgi:hypothetical protein